MSLSINDLQESPKIILLECTHTVICIESFFSTKKQRSDGNLCLVSLKLGSSAKHGQSDMEEQNPMIVKELETTVSSRKVSSQPDTITTKEYLQACCRVSYRTRKLKNKGAILVLVWNFLVMSVFNYLLTYYQDIVSNSVLAIIGVMLPITGWLADVHFGRYKVIRCSIRIMWISSVLLTTTYVVFSFTEFNHSNLTCKTLIIILIFVLAFGLGAFQANIIQFGIDQLSDASTTEITSFVAWYTWTLTSSNTIVGFINMLTCIELKYYLVGPLLITTCLTIVVSTNYLFSNQLIKEPVTQNPFKLVYKVVRYAIKNKHPRQRSAFTYWEDHIPSRIDFGKIRYGGPFTTEQVEDVKMFFKMLGIAFIGSLLVSTEISFLNVEFYTTYLTKLFGNNGHTESILSQCFHKHFFANIHIILRFLLIPLNEFLFYPLLHQCIVIKSHSKILLGTLFELAGFTVLVILITYARSQYIEITDTALSHNYTIQCLFHMKSNSLKTRSVIDYRWFVLVQFLFAVSNMMLVVGVIEFYCAQVPYSMKGLMAGIYYGFLGLCTMFNYGLSQVFKAKLHIWETRTIFSCGFWYLLTKIILIFIASLVALLIVKYYKKRKREDVLPNEHIFAEQYYSVETSSD